MRLYELVKPDEMDIWIYKIPCFKSTHFEKGVLKIYVQRIKDKLALCMKIKKIDLFFGFSDGVMDEHWTKGLTCLFKY